MIKYYLDEEIIIKNVERIFVITKRIENMF